MVSATACLTVLDSNLGFDVELSLVLLLVKLVILGLLLLSLLLLSLLLLVMLPQQTGCCLCCCLCICYTAGPNCVRYAATNAAAFVIAASVAMRGEACALIGECCLLRGEC